MAVPAVAWLFYITIGILIYGPSKVFCRKVRDQDRQKKKLAKNLSLERAKEKANQLRLFKVKRDPKTHLPLAGTQTLFKFFDPPESVGMESVGLGFYFYHLNMFLLILLICSITYAVNISQYYNNMEFEKSYVLQFDVIGGQKTNVTCDRPYNVHTLITRMSAGSLCVKSESSNPYFCPATCSVRLPDYHEVDLNDPNACKNHKPCEHAGKNPEHKCCNIEQDFTAKNFPFLSVWVSLLSVILFSLWIVYNRIFSNRLGMKLNSSVITASDYTVLISGLDEKDCTRSDLTDFFSHYGYISWCTPVPRIGSVVKNREEIADLEEMKRELSLHSEETFDTHTISGILFVMAYFGVSFLLRGLTLGFEKAKKVHIEWIGERIRFLKEEAKAAQKQSLEDIDSHRNTGQAFVTFTYESMASNAFIDQKRPISKTFNKYTCTSLSKYPTLKGRTIKVERAPEPSDFRWENTSIFGWRQGLRILCSNFGTILVLCIGALIQLQLEFWKADALDELSEYKVVNAGKEDNEFLLKQTQVRSLSFASSLAIVVVNLTMHGIAGFFSEFESWHSWSDTEKYLLLKLSIAYFLNTVVVPLLASTRKNWYVEGGFAEQVFYTQLIDAMMAPLMALIDPSWLCSRMSCKYVQTQRVLDDLVAPSVFKLSIRYADAIKTLSMAVIFAPMVPTSPLIGFVGIVIQCATDRVVAFRMCQRPRQLQEGVMDGVFFLLRCIPPMQILLMYYSFAGIRTILIVAAAVMLAAGFVGVWKGKRNKELEDAGTGGLSFEKASTSCDLSVDQVEIPDNFEDFFTKSPKEEDAEKGQGKKRNSKFNINEVYEFLGEKASSILKATNRNDEDEEGGGGSRNSADFFDCQGENDDEGNGGNSGGEIRADGEGEGPSLSRVSSGATSTRSGIERVRDNIKQKYFTYMPNPSVTLPVDLQEKIDMMFDIDADMGNGRSIFDPNPELMPYQNRETGGPENVRKPRSRSARKSSIFSQFGSAANALGDHLSGGIKKIRKRTLMSIFSQEEDHAQALQDRSKSFAKLETSNPLLDSRQAQEEEAAVASSEIELQLK